MKYGVLKRFFEMAERWGKTLNEVFAVVPNSYQDYSSQIREALREDPPEDFSRDDWAYVEAVIGDEPDQVLLECYHSSGKFAYYLYDVTFEDGTVKWSNQREVEIEAALKAKPVMERRMNEVVDPPQDLVVDVSDFEIAFEDDSKVYASVAIAQKADVKNKNNRIYPKDVLEDAVVRLKDRITLTGPIAMETMHRDARYIGDVCAVIHEVAFNLQTGIVTLPKIELLETTSGKNVQVLLDVVPAFQVSQRGLGISHEEIDPNTGLRVQIMDWLEIQGWDMVWNGDASVEAAVLTLNEEASGAPVPSVDPVPETPPATVSVPVSVPAGAPARTPASVQPSQGRPTGAYFRPPANGGDPVPETPPVAVPVVAPAAAAVAAQEQQGLLGKEVLSLVKTAVQQALGPVVSTMETETKELRQKEFKRIADEVLDTVLAKHPRFTEKQKAAIKSGINVSAAYAQVESLDVSSITRVLTPVLEAEIEQADKLIATKEVDEWGVSGQAVQSGSRHINAYGGATYSEVINDAHASGIFDAADYNVVTEGAIDLMTRGDRENNWVMPLDHPGMKPLAQVMNTFYHAYGPQLAVETAASGVAIPVTQVSMLLVPTVWRMTTAFQVSQLHPMSLMVEDIPIERWTGQQSAKNEYEKWDSLDPGDSQVIPESVLDYEYYRLAAGYQPQHVRVTPRARAITRNTVMNPTMRSTALAAREIVDQNDTMLWRALIMEALKFEALKVSTFTALVRVASTNEYTVKPGLIPYEWVVRHDTNKNVSKSGLIRNFPVDGEAVAAELSGERTLQPLELQEGAGDNTPLLYGTDYTADWVKGTIILTAAGRAKASTANGVRAKYSYATNLSIWNATVPSGSTFIEHLVDLRLRIADARTKIKDRHYMPECIAWNYGLMDKVSAGKNFTNEGGNIAQAIDMMSNILRYAGSESVDSTAIPPEYVICTQKMSILFGMHTPFTLTGEVITDNTGDRRYFGEQFAGSAVPAPEKVSIVAVENVP